MRNIIFTGMALLAISSCKPKADPASIQGNDYAPQALNPNYDWTGTYYYADAGAETSYQVKLHKRSVDGSYEMQYTKGAEGNKNNYAEYMFDARDGEKSICIRFMGSFSVEENLWPFKKGDTLFLLSLAQDSSIVTAWKALQPRDEKGTFRQISKDYH